MHAVVDLRLTQSAVPLAAVNNPPQRVAAGVRRADLPNKVCVLRDALDASKGNWRSVDARPPTNCPAEDQYQRVPDQLAEEGIKCVSHDRWRSLGHDCGNSDKKGLSPKKIATIGHGILEAASIKGADP
jgi:hypothetical protein